VDAPIRSDVVVEVARLLVVALATGAGHQLAGAGGAAIGAGVGYVVGGASGRLLRRASGDLVARAAGTPAVTLAGGATGALLLGGLAALVGAVALAALPGRWGWPVLALATWSGIYVGSHVGAAKGAELVGALVAAPAAGAVAALVDTSAAMDGRLLGLARAGFLPAPLGVAPFVVDELRGLAGAADVTRRRRAHRALEVLDVLRGDGAIVVLADEVPDRAGVGAKLLALADRLGAGVVTTDADLAAAADLRGLACLDLRLIGGDDEPVPGEVVRVTVRRHGRDEGQGVGFLDDGTMVVVADGASRVGEAVEVTITSSIDTSRGRLLFASPA
jgi:uncharacterized protein YacL